MFFSGNREPERLSDEDRESEKFFGQGLITTQVFQNSRKQRQTVALDQSSRFVDPIQG